LFDYKVLEGDELIRAFHFRMSSANTPDSNASWLEGFLKGSGSILLIDQDLWTLVSQWVGQLDSQAFVQVLPLLRRTFSGFSQPERRKLGEKVKTGGISTGIKIIQDNNVDMERGRKGIPIVLQLLGLKQPTVNNG